MKKVFKSAMMYLAAMALFLTSCDQMNDTENSGNGKVVLSLTDAPFPVSLVDQAVVSIDKIEIRTKAVKATTEEEADKESQYVVLYEGAEKEFDLLDLQNGVTAELLSLDILPGSYDFIRMHITKAAVILQDGTKFDLKIPGGSTSGLKIKITPDLVIESGVESEVVLDFDVSKSFVAQGNIKSKNGIKGFIFKPVLRAVCQKYSGIIAGKVSENATTPVIEAHVQVISADTVLSSALTDKTGNYKMIGLPSGTYKIICEKDGYTKVTIDPVVVKARETTLQNITLTK